MLTRTVLAVLVVGTMLGVTTGCATSGSVQSAASAGRTGPTGPVSPSSLTSLGSLLPTSTATSPATTAERLYCRQEHDGWDRYLVKAVPTTVAFDIRTTDTGKEIRTPAWPHYTYFPTAAKPTPVDSPLIRIAHGSIEYTPNGYFALFGGRTRSAQQAAYDALWHSYEIDQWANDLCEVGLCG